MTKYVCIYCGAVVEYKELIKKEQEGFLNKIQCPKCGRKIFIKLPYEKPRTLLAR